MTEQEILERIQRLLREQLENDDIELQPATTANDVNGWDSLTHVQLISAIEKEFKIRLSSREIFKWNNVGEMVASVASKS